MSFGFEYPSLAAQAAASERAAFIRRTYAHLAGAILAFVGIEAFLLNVVDERLIWGVLAGKPMMWLVVMFAFMGAGWIAQTMAYSNSSRGVQYAGLALYVVAEAIIFLPLLIVAKNMVDKTVIPIAGILTLAVFGGLTASVFVTRKDYSSLRPILAVGSLLAVGLIIAACLFPFPLGLLFSFAMVALMSGYILYYTSEVLLRFRTDQHVAAALTLFAAVATLFWYILRIVMAFSSRD
jgi:FtsH-binding integral membrane protein